MASLFRRFLEKEIKKDEFPILDMNESPEAPAPREMIDLENTFDKLENELKEVNSSAEQLKRTYLELTELKQILRKTQSFFDEANPMWISDYNHEQSAYDPNRGANENVGLLDEDGVQTGGSRLGFIAGVILRDRLAAFERMLWRACRGNVYLKQAEIETALEDPVTGDKVKKSVFIIFFQGDQLKTRVKKICEGFHASIYPCPENQNSRREMTMQVMNKTDDLETVLNQTKQHRERILETAAKNIRIWFIKVRKIKAIYHTLNLFNLDVTTKCMVGECWCAVNDLDKIRMALRRGTERSSNTLQPILNGLPTKESPPTYHRVNKFTAAFQNIVDAYGVAKYREVNPTLFTIITFPFLFAVMFGDAGHGTIMFLFALWMVIREKQLIKEKITDEIWNTFFGGRYIILLMGAFSIYTGFMYNDLFSKSMNIFGSSWFPNYDMSTIHANPDLQLDPTPNISNPMFSGNPYPFGIDPIWQMSSNKITFLNSMKMKMSIIFGVLHMLFGVSLSVFNHKMFKDKLAIYCEFIPQIIFLTAIFGYLVVMIFYKWFAYDATLASQAPSLLIMLINILPRGDTPMFYKGQRAIQTILVLLALACVPWMLIVKPVILYRRHKQKLLASNMLVHADKTESMTELEDGMPELGHGDTSVSYDDEQPLHNENEEEAENDAEGGSAKPSVPPSRPTVGPGEVKPGDTFDNLQQDETVKPVPHESAEPDLDEFSLGDTIVYQAIHTIEYCLGCISNTASYLRLWALSLAHAQLSEVLWTMVMQRGTKINASYGGIGLFVIFGFWAVLTVAVLIIMEGLSAFLHALRLHWVEFNNKFYAGNGYMFVPFSFSAYINQIDEAMS